MRHLILRHFIQNANRSAQVSPIRASMNVLMIASTLISLVLLAQTPEAAAQAGQAVKVHADAAAAAATSVSPQVVRQAKLERIRNRKKRSAREVLGSVDPDIDVNAGVGGNKARAQFGYNYSVDPSYQSGLYTRTDRWHPQGALQLIPGFKAVPGAEVVVIRQFKSKSDALKAKPLLKLGSLPFSAEKALDMAPGSIVMVPVRLEIYEGAQGSTQLTGPLSASGRVGHVDRGTYQIQAQRLEGNKVRLRVLATRHHAFEGEASLRLGVLPFGKRIATVSKSKGSRSLISSEYVFDLANEKTRHAYNELFKPDRLRPRMDMANPFMNTKKLEENMRDGVSPLQQIIEEDSALPQHQRRIVQAFNGRTISKPTESRVGIKLLGAANFARTSSFSSDTRLAYNDENNVRHEAFAPTAETSKRLRLLFGLRNEVQTRRASVIAKTDELGQPIGTGEYVVTLELKDKRMGKSETDKARVKLKRMIAPSILKKMGIEPILTSTAYKNARIYTQVVFTENAFARIQGLSATQLEVALTKYLTEIKDPFFDKEKGIRRASEILAESLRHGETPEEKIKLFSELQKEKLFRESGTGFMMSLLPEAELEDLVSVYVRVDATAFGDKPIKVAFGHSDFRNLEKATECADYQQNRTNIDLRLEDVCAAPVAESSSVLQSTSPAASPAASQATSPVGPSSPSAPAGVSIAPVTRAQH